MQDDSIQLLALSLIPGLGTVRIHQLLKKFNGRPSRLFRLARAELARMSLGLDIADWITDGLALRAADQVLKETSQNGVAVVSLADESYPHLLRSIYNAPIVIYCLGDLNIAKQAAVAMVGSRRASVYGRQVTQKLAGELAATGLVIVSGMARGIDSFAHLGALEAGGRTVAVLGNGVDVVYPREHRRLYERIREQGCILSEFACGTFPAVQNFPIRNRIISGLCYGTVIAEASEYSGSLITARLTLEQNRELWAIPGNITNPGSYGPNYLIKQGARIVLDKQDILEELPVYVLDQLKAVPSVGPPQQQPLDASEKLVLGMLAVDAPLHFDVLLDRSKLTLPQLNDCLLRLQMKGLASQLPGRRYNRVLK